MRKFEKISLNEFIRSTGLSEKEYNETHLPQRATSHSAGYDFYLIEKITLKPKEIKKVPTAIKVKMNHNDVLMLFIRSNLGFKYNLRLCNQAGIIDSDYYNNQDNEGHIFVSLQNEGSKTISLNAGERFIQGIFINYLTVDNENKITKSRTGGIGSTN